MISEYFGLGGKDCYVILWLGINEFTIVDGTLNDAVAEAKGDGNFRNYGRTGAIILKTSKVYEIDLEGKEDIEDLCPNQ